MPARSNNEVERTKMKSLSGFNLFLIFIGVISLSVTLCKGNELSEFKSLLQFIRAVDPKGVLKVGRNVQYSCKNNLKGVLCNSVNSITEIRLEHLHLSGTLDVDSLCKLPNLRVVSLARNHIRGTISNSIVHCTRLNYLNVSNNLLSGSIPKPLRRLQFSRRLHVSNNYFTRDIPSLKEKHQQLHPMRIMMESGSPSLPPKPGAKRHWYTKVDHMLPLVLGIGFFLVFIFFAGRMAAKLATDKEILKSLHEYSTPQSPLAKVQEEEKPVENQTELVFFVEKHESFKLEDLLEATADLRNQSFCSSLYKVILKNNALYAVKRMKKLQVPLKEFCQAMNQIGNIKHPNIMPLVGYNSNNEEKLLIYKYQSNGSLLNLLEDYTLGKRDFPWRMRLSVARGIARGLDFIYKRTDECIPHGNLKLSNILLDEKDEPLISDYGLSKFSDPLKGCVIISNGYTAPEKELSEKADVYSFGVILLELLTSKTVETSGIDLPKWVTAMVKEEWTGEVFDKEVAKSAKEWAFPLLNIALKCVSASPPNRPSVAQVYDKIEEVMQDTLNTSDCTADCGSYEDNFCMLHSIIPETWDTPGSNY